MVAVVGADNFLRDITEVDKLKDRKQEMGDGDGCNIVDLLRRSDSLRQRSGIPTDNRDFFRCPDN
jgi:hypothetical protein